MQSQIPTEPCPVVRILIAVSFTVFILLVAARIDARPPEGTVKGFAFSQSRIFPGTRRQGWVFVPAQYDSARPACVYVRQDGYNAAEKGMLETLIAAGDMPVTVGVFITSGDLPPAKPGTMGRRNRSFEYDAVDDAYVRFLVEELLPFVAKEFHLNLSDKGNDRCIAGGSSGGIAAFNAAWQRPDAFSRVYANSGSFVAFRGGHEFPTLVRKVEAKPIRTYLTTGTHDMVNCAGDWYLLDQEMDQALKFSGYDYFFRAIEGPHVAGWNEYFPEAMRFIWKGWPAAVKAGPSAPRVRDVIRSDEGWTLAADGFAAARAPPATPRARYCSPILRPTKYIASGWMARRASFSPIPGMLERWRWGRRARSTLSRSQPGGSSALTQWARGM